MRASAARIAALQQRVQKDVVGLEHRIGLEFAAPVALRMLPGEEKLPRADRWPTPHPPGPRRAGQIWAPRIVSFAALDSCGSKRLSSFRKNQNPITFMVPIAPHAASLAHRTLIPRPECRRPRSLKPGNPIHRTGTGSSPPALPMACTISGGRPKRTFSGITSTSSTLVKPF